MNNISEQPTDSSILDRCSTACTRAGLAALILAAISISLLGPLEDLRKFNHLGTYLNLRYTLVEALKSLEEDPCWLDLQGRKGEVSAREWTLEELGKVICSPPPGRSEDKSTDQSQSKTSGRVFFASENKVAEKTTGDTESPLKSPDSPTRKGPSAPTLFSPSGLKIVWGLVALPGIENSAAQLCDFKLLNDAMQYSARYAFSIQRWQRHRDALLARVSGKSFHSGTWTLEEAPSSQDKALSSPNSEEPKTSTGYNPPPDKLPRALDQQRRALTVERFLIDMSKARKDVVPKLTVEEVKELAYYELPKLDEIEPIIKEIGRTDIGSFVKPLSLFSASAFVQLSLCVVMLYFFLFLKEAEVSDSFPGSGTIFSVLLRSRSRHILFCSLTTIPPIASSLLTFKFWYPAGQNFDLSFLIPMTISCLVVILISTLVYRQSSQARKRAFPPIAPQVPCSLRPHSNRRG